MKLKSTLFLLLGWLLAASTSVKARVYLGAPFKGSIVIQQNADVAFWGSGRKGDTISITSSWSNDTVRCRVGDDGRWYTHYRTPAGSFTKQMMRFRDTSGSSTSLYGMYIGEVWVASGQSNMEFPVNGWSSSPSLDKDSLVAAAANYTGKIKWVTIPERLNSTPQDSTTVQWQNCNSGTAGGFSCVAFIFACHLSDSLGVPIGVINASYGGSSVEAWCSRETIESFNITLSDATFTNMNQRTSTACYNAMINPIKGYTARGFIWYQGEANGGQKTYEKRFSTMITDWRKAWGNNDMPFYYAELAPYASGDATATSWALTRELQCKVQHELPLTRMVGLNDCVLPSEINQIHPGHKVKVGRRMGDCALHDVYGFDHINPASPELASFRFADGKAYLTFTNAEDGFNITSGIEGFELGDDNNLATATAVVEGNEVVVSAEGITSPTYVRYCYRNFLLGNLKNKAGLPVIGFHTDGEQKTNLDNGYYRVISNSDKSAAFRYLTHQLHWDKLDKTAPDEIFYLEKSSDTTYPYSTDEGGFQYYQVQSLATGEWFSGQTDYSRYEMHGDMSSRLPLDFARQGDGTYLVRTPGIRWDFGTTYDHTYAGMCLMPSKQRNYKYFNQWNNTGGTYAWRVEKVTDAELNAAKMRLAVKEAYKIYNSRLAYDEDSVGLINIPTKASDTYGTGTPIFVSGSINDGTGSADFTHLVDGKTSTYFQSAWSGKYADKTTAVTAPQFFQVDLGEDATSRGVRMKMGLREGSWGCSSQPAAITLFATNDSEAAAGDFTLADCSSDSKWLKIGESKLDESKSVTYTTSHNVSQCTWNNASANTYLYENFGLKDETYRYLRFYVNNTLFPNSDLMDYCLSELQLYDLEDVAVIGSKKYLVNQLNNAVKTAEDVLKAGAAGTPTAAQLKVLTDAIEQEENNASVSIDETGFATFVSDRAVQIPEGLEVYKVTGYATTANQSHVFLEKALEAGQVLPAGTPVIMKGTAGTDYVLPYSSATGTRIGSSLLRGQALKHTKQNGTNAYYVLTNRSTSDATPVFKKIDAGAKIPAGYAYFNLSGNQLPDAYELQIEGETGIHSAVNDDAAGTKYYDLEGRRVEKPSKGIFILNGKKVIVK